MKIKAILFDLDGVLVDATEWHYEALNRALGLFGFNIARYEHLTTYNGLPTRKKLEMLSVEKGFPRGLQSLTHQIRQKYTREEILRSCTPVFEKEFMVHQPNATASNWACAPIPSAKAWMTLQGQRAVESFDLVRATRRRRRPSPTPMCISRRANGSA